ncbi:preprotein translocase subunit SecY [archaeon]|nr:MAG: preprotein translocase subunit SecY [archaeon]RLG66133.1 MAG: preprotein translocase subunit SecY [archaeon]HDM23603.1 preprotein translocase subunit SecY [Candidatus Bathyarchaeota archaeon]
MARFIEFFKPVARYIPEIKKPGMISFKEKMFWTLFALLAYLIMAQIPLYGLPLRELGPTAMDPFYGMRVLLASSRGTLMELGIGPIVTAGLVLQLLAGGKIIDVDFTNPEDRALFTSAQKVLTIVIIFFEATAYIAGGLYGTLSFMQAILIMLQLLAAGVIVMLIDEMIQKGWGFGSGVSLFIAAGVCQRVMWMMFSPIVAEDKFPLGFFTALTYTLMRGEDLGYLILRSAGLPSLVGLITTITVFLLIIYMESVRVEIPISYARFRGYKSKYPLKLLYVSNIPIIFAAAFLAEALFFIRILWSNMNSDNSNIWLNLIGVFNSSNPNQALGGLAYYLTPPRSIQETLSDPLRALVYTLILVVICIVFAVTWVEVTQMNAREVAKQLVYSGMQIPGFRRSVGVLRTILEQYIPYLTILSGILIGLLSATADIFGAYGTGSGILLCVGILYQYYQILTRERLVEMHPAIRKLLGEE